MMNKKYGRARCAEVAPRLNDALRETAMPTCDPAGHGELVPAAGPRERVIT